MLAVAMTATGVAVCGPISFIGLVVPHMVRRIAGGRHRWLMPVSALTGALLLVIADLLARIIHPPLELPAGVLDRHYRRTVVCLAACENAINEITY